MFNFILALMTALAAYTYHSTALAVAVLLVMPVALQITNPKPKTVHHA